jgi:hypothetical protein
VIADEDPIQDLQADQLHQLSDTTYDFHRVLPDRAR